MEAVVTNTVKILEAEKRGPPLYVFFGKNIYIAIIAIIIIIIIFFYYDREPTLFFINNTIIVLTVYENPHRYACVAIFSSIKSYATQAILLSCV